MENLFFSETLANKLQTIKKCALSALEAPAGYGKTTAIRQLLGESDATVCWFTAVEGMADNSFHWFVRQIGVIDEIAARRLEDLGYLNRSNAGQAARIISEIRPNGPLTLVFDNFQFVLQSWQPQVLDALAKCGNGRLRTVFISQNFGRLRDVLNSLEGSVCYIRSGDLLLSEANIGTYASQLGISVSENEIRAIYHKTNGWTAAVALYLENLREGVTDSGGEGLDELLAYTFWQKLNDRQRHALLRVCLFDQITGSTLDRLVPGDLLPQDELIQLLRRAPLVLYRETRKAWYPHELLTAFLRRRLVETDKNFRYEVLRASAGTMNQSFHAIWCASSRNSSMACRIRLLHVQCWKSARRACSNGIPIHCSDCVTRFIPAVHLRCSTIICSVSADFWKRSEMSS